jgi:hypothetical protein
MGYTKYTITGQSNRRPENLPDGFEVVAEPVVFSKETPGFALADSAYRDGQLFINQQGSYGRHFSAEDVRALRDALTEWLSQTCAMRVVHDENDSATSSWRWYEIKPNKFVYDLSEQNARRDAERFKDGRPTTDLLSFEEIEERYGIRTVTTWEV